jgi:hypothetical protein
MNVTETTATHAVAFACFALTQMSHLHQMSQINATYRTVIKVLTLFSAIVILVGTIVPFVDTNYRVNYGEDIIFKFLFVGYYFLIFSIIIDLHLYMQEGTKTTQVIGD